jgi:hypothetical protein
MFTSICRLAQSKEFIIESANLLGQNFLKLIAV